jgi:hypothetical protein
MLADPATGLCGIARRLGVRDAYAAFRDHTLIPAMQRIASEHGIDMSQAPPPETVVTAVSGLVRGR